jgi:hypothetical protein
VDFGKDVLGVGVDHGTALMIDAEGKGAVIGKGTVSFLRFGTSTVVDLQYGEPPKIVDISYDRLATGGRYNVVQQRVASLPGERIDPVGETLERMIADTWARDGKLESRIEDAHTSLASHSVGVVVLFGPGFLVERVAAGMDSVTRVDGAPHPPCALVRLGLRSFNVGGEEPASPDTAVRTLLPGDSPRLSFRGGQLDLHAPPPVFRRVPNAAPAEGAPTPK